MTWHSHVTCNFFGELHFSHVNNSISYTPQSQPLTLCLLSQERNGILLSRSNLAKTQMSKAFGQRWQGMPAAETELYHELEDADTARYEQEAYARDTASRLA